MAKLPCSFSNSAICVSHFASDCRGHPCGNREKLRKFNSPLPWDSRPLPGSWPEVVLCVSILIIASRNMCGLQLGPEGSGQGLRPQRQLGREGSPGRRFPDCCGGPAAPVCWWPAHASGSLEHPVALESEAEAKQKQCERGTQGKGCTWGCISHAIDRECTSNRSEF